MLRFCLFSCLILYIPITLAQQPHISDNEIFEPSITYTYSADSTVTRWSNDKDKFLNGSYKVVHEDSTLLFAEFKEGLLDGVVEGYYKTGELESKEFYLMGVRNDTSVWYYKKGGAKRRIPYNNLDKNGVCVWYYQSGQPLKECNYDNGKEQGVCKWYFAKGNLKWLVTYERGIKNGAVQKYKNNGNLEFNGYFLNDKQVSKAVFERDRSKQ